MSQPSHREQIKGRGASKGEATGRAYYIESINNIDKIKDGEILLCRMTSPDWVPAMRRASAIVTKVGGILCHAAIVSRELGIPCVVAVGSVISKLDGKVIEVDGGKGIVRIVAG